MLAVADNRCLGTRHRCKIAINVAAQVMGFTSRQSPKGSRELLIRKLGWHGVPQHRVSNLDDPTSAFNSLLIGFCVTRNAI